MTTKKQEDKPTLDPHARNPQVALGKGEQLGPDLLKFEEDGTVTTVDGVPEPAYDLNDWDDRAQPLDEEPKDYYAVLADAEDEAAKEKDEGPDPKPEPEPRKPAAKK